MEFRVLQGVPPADVRAFLAMARKRSFDRSEVVFHEGDAADAVHLITEGRFALRVVSALGQSAMLAVRAAGRDLWRVRPASLPARSARLPSPHSSPARRSRLGRDAFRGLVRRHPSLMDVLVALLAERLRYSDQRIRAAHFLDADARVRWSLLQLVPIYGDGESVAVPLTQESLAELAGTARGTVNRVLRD